MPGFAELEPPGLTPDENSLQQRKSAETRTAILEAATDCLATYGYAATTFRLISELSGISKGAMTHHYASRIELVAAVIDYALFKLIEAFSEAVRGMPDPARKQIHEAVLLDWSLYDTREYRAYLELIVAARTDDELQELFIPRARRLDRVRMAEMVENFPEWAGNTERLVVARRFSQSIASGLMLNREIWDDPKVEASVLHLWATFLLQIRNGEVGIEPPSPPGDGAG